MKTKTLFPALPDDLAALSREDLSALVDEFRAAAVRIAENDAEFLEDLDGEAVLSQMTAGADALAAIETELGSRDAAEATYASSVADLAAKFGVGAPIADVEETPAVEVDALAADDDYEDPEDDAEVTSDVTDDEKVAVVASAAPRVARPFTVPASHRPRITVTENHGAALIASAGLDMLGVRMGAQITDPSVLARCAAQVWGTLSPRPGEKAKAIVASAHLDYPDHLTLGDNPRENGQKIAALFAPQALVASGGFCAPPTPIYDLPFMATAQTPVWSSLPKVQATRGGITFPTPLGLSDVTDGITVVTAAEDEAGGTGAVKNVVTIDCDAFQEAFVSAVAAGVEHGNLNARAWPERVENVNQLLAAAHAQATEGHLLSLMTAASTTRTDGAWYGAYSTLVQGVLKAAAAYRSRHRMDPLTVLECYMPAWVRELIAADFAGRPYDALDPAAALAAVDAKFAALRVRVTWYIDQDGTTDQVYGADGASTLDGFLTSVVWYLFAPGTFLGLDQGRLDFGVVRDSDLNSTNDFQSMYETFIGLAMTGIQSMRVVSTVCPDGTYAPANTKETC